MLTTDLVRSYISRSVASTSRSTAAALQPGGRLRKLIFLAHLWTGLGLGLYTALLGITGSLLVFMPELDAAMNARLYQVAPSGPRLPLDAAVSAVRARHPDAKINAVSISEVSTAPYLLRVGGGKRGEWNSNGADRGREIYVNPFTAEIIAERVRYGDVFNFVYFLHTELLLGKGGLKISGILAIFFGLLLLTGVWLWWPTARNLATQLRLRLTVQRGASYRRLIHDLHNVLGIYPLVILLLPVLTAPVLAYWEPVAQFMAMVTASKVNKRTEVTLQIPGNPPSLSFERALQIGATIEPNAIVEAVNVPRNQDRPIRISKRFAAGHSLPRAHVTLFLHPITGALMRTEDSRQVPRGQRVMQWMVPLHFGLWGARLGPLADYLVRALYLFAGLAPLGLFVTGVLKYAEKRRAKIANRQRRAVHAGSPPPVTEPVPR